MNIKGSTSDSTESIEWHLRVFGGVRIAKIDVAGQGPVIGAHVEGATAEDGRSLIGYGSTRNEAVQALWKALTGMRGTGIIFAGSSYEWSASGMFQQVLK